MDSRFRVEVLSQTLNPQQVIYAALHQDYSEDFVWDERESFPGEEKCGEIIARRLLKPSHFGPLEHPQIVLNCGYFPHSTMQQIRTHRVGISFDVSSFRYTSQGIIDAATGTKSIDDVFYLRPVGEYSDRQGKRYTYTEQQRQRDIEICQALAVHYAQRIDEGFSEEHARGMIPFDVRQHWVMSMNVRSLMHLLDMRSPANAQLECQQLCELILPHFKAWVPDIAEWYIANRLHKSRLAP